MAKVSVQKKTAKAKAPTKKTKTIAKKVKKSTTTSKAGKLS